MPFLFLERGSASPAPRTSICHTPSQEWHIFFYFAFFALSGYCRSSIIDCRAGARHAVLWKPDPKFPGAQNV